MSEVPNEVTIAVHDDASPASAARFEVLERTYAEAIYAAAEKEGVVESLLTEMEAILALLTSNSDFATVIGSARLNLQQRRELLQRVFHSVGETTMRVLQVLATRERLRYLQGVIRRLRRLHDEKHGLVRVRVEAPVELTEQQKKALVDRLRTGLKIEPRLTCVVRPELLGGMVVRIEDTVYDGSVRSRLDLLRREILTRSVHEIQSGRDRFSY
ncbi:MAG TPA: ATP synthase F1 subunit delta, partial [Pirellulales bacterium]